MTQSELDKLEQKEVELYDEDVVLNRWKRSYPDKLKAVHTLWMSDAGWIFMIKNNYLDKYGFWKSMAGKRCKYYGWKEIKN